MDMGIFYSGKELVRYEKGDWGLVRSTISVSKLSDRYKFVKLFSNGLLSAWPVVVKWDLKTTRLFLYLPLLVKEGEDMVEIDPSVMVSELGLNRRSELDSAVLSLISSRVLAAYSGAENHFWFNPSLMFNGDRRFLLSDDGVTLDSEVIERAFKDKDCFRKSLEEIKKIKKNPKK
jgi:hypothetical protein